ncbi:MAG: transposase [Sphingobacteriales bacterium]|nr:transposase [Sphingobacteriales bacterium]
MDLPFLSVSSVSFDSDKLVVTCHSQLGEGICPCCKKKTTKVNQRYHRSVSDLPISGRSVVLNLEVRQFICLDCNRTFSERFDFVSESTNTTHHRRSGCLCFAKTTY